MGKTKERKKESQLVIRVEKAEKTAFLTLCEALDTSAGRELRRFMRAFVAAKSAQVEEDATAKDAAAAPKKAKKARTAEPAEAPAPMETASMETAAAETGTGKTAPEGGVAAAQDPAAADSPPAAAKPRKRAAKAPAGSL